MNTEQEAFGLLREAKEDLDGAIRSVGSKEWRTAVLYSQLAIEKSAKAVISCVETFEWTHDPSKQMSALIKADRLPLDLAPLAGCAKEAAPWHGRSTYGARVNDHRQTPSDLCTEQVALDLLGKARMCFEKAHLFVKEFFRK
jgi:HEPN domain-containing protein